jgi:predicted alpha/beta hydrolase family esterase
MERAQVRSTVLFVPGLRDHVPEHWQTLLAEELPGSRTVEPLPHGKLSCAARVEALDRAIAEIEGAVVLVAHSAGCLMVAHWAQRHARPVAAALLVCPVDAETPLPAGYPTLDELGANGWLPTPRRPLPFRAVVALSSNDPLAGEARSEALAQAWGGEIVRLGEVGHLNPAAGFGPWPAGKPLIQTLEAAARG